MTRTTTFLTATVLVVIINSCKQRSEVRSHTTPQVPAAPKIGFVFLTRDGCVNTPLLRTNLEQALHALQMPIDYTIIDQTTLSPSDPMSGYATPTLLLDNRDLFGMPQPTPPFSAPT